MLSFLFKKVKTNGGYGVVWSIAGCRGMEIGNQRNIMCQCEGKETKK
jgi:hypothetical protein